MASIKCPKCGANNDSSMFFCEKCGTVLRPDEASAAHAENGAQASAAKAEAARRAASMEAQAARRKKVRGLAIGLCLLAAAVVAGAATVTTKVIKNNKAQEAEQDTSKEGTTAKDEKEKQDAKADDKKADDKKADDKKADDKKADSKDADKKDGETKSSDSSEGSGNGASAASTAGSGNGSTATPAAGSGNGTSATSAAGTGNGTAGTQTGSGNGTSGASSGTSGGNTSGNSGQASQPAQPAAPSFGTASASSELPGDAETSYYGAKNAIDGSNATAWNTNGSGIGATLKLSASSKQAVNGISIVGGYPSSSAVYYYNARPEIITITLGDGYSIQFHMEDLYNQAQEIVFDKIHQTDSITIKIDSVYPGNTYEECCIAEVKVF